MPKGKRDPLLSVDKGVFLLVQMQEVGTLEYHHICKEASLGVFSKY